MSDPIKAALEAAGEAVRQNLIKPPCCMEGTGCELPPCHCSSVAAAAAIAAFLEAMPEDPDHECHTVGCVGSNYAGEGHERTTGYWAAKMLAAAVRRAALCLNWSESEPQPTQPATRAACGRRLMLWLGAQWRLGSKSAAATGVSHPFHRRLSAAAIRC